MNQLVPKPARCAIFLLSALATVAGSAQPALAQRPKPSDRDPGLARAQAVLNDRNREMIHPGDPLTIVGLEQGGNDIRSRTPILANSDRIAAHVDPDDNYRRTIAMYDEGASFHSAPASSMRAGPSLASPGGASRSARAGAPAQAAAAAPSEGRSEWPWVLGFGACLFAGLWLWMRSGTPIPARSPSRSRAA